MPVNSFADKLVKKDFWIEQRYFLKQARPIVARINEWEPKIQKLSDDELKETDLKFKEIIARHLEGISDKTERRRAEQEILHELLPEALLPFARLRAA